MTTGSADGENTTEQSPRSRRVTWRRIARSVWFQLALAFIVMGLVLNFVAKPYAVPSGSMEQTLLVGDRVLVNRLALLGGGPSTGDVIVFDAGAQWDDAPYVEANPLRAVLRWLGEVSGFGPSSAHTLVKRVIAGPGQTVECCNVDGALTVDGIALDESYVFDDYPYEPGTLDCDTSPRSLRCFDAVTVPGDSYLVLGDHRSNSSDSAARCRRDAAAADCWRWVARDDIVGKTQAIIWPVGRWSGL